LGRTRLAHSWQRLDVARQFRQAVVCGEQFHLLDGDLIEAGEGFGLFSGPELIEILSGTFSFSINSSMAWLHANSI
jgi:hypothetical protein